MLSNNNLIIIGNDIYRLEFWIRTFKDFYNHLKYNGLGDNCPNCGVYNYFSLRDITFTKLDRMGSAKYTCNNPLCDFSFEIQPLRKESS